MHLNSSPNMKSISSNHGSAIRSHRDSVKTPTSQDDRNHLVSQLDIYVKFKVDLDLYYKDLLETNSEISIQDIINNFI